MQVDHALILAAGKGTRMGEIGNVLPKVIWPIFEKSILELEVLYAKSLGAKNTYINLFNHKDRILKHINERVVFSDVRAIVENEVLDIGGAVHNLAKNINYSGNLLILNSDQFIMFDDMIFQKAQQLLIDNDVVLFTYNVNINEGYNKIDIFENRMMKSITLNKDISKDSIFETYTGMSLIKLESLSPKNGESRFFESVANPDNLKIKCLNIEDAVYWDFGTTLRYHKSMFQILDKINQSDAFVDFLIHNGGVNLSKIKEGSYFSNNNEGINLTKKVQDLDKGTILLSGEGFLLEKNSIIYNEITQSVY